MPVRKIPKSYRNVTGILPSIKSSFPVEFESTLERDVLAILELDPKVKTYEVQPVQINWLDSNNKNRTYTPDVLVQFHDKRPILYEIKYSNDLEELLKEEKDKFRAVIGYARRQGWRFKFYTNNKVSTNYIKNVRFLLPFFHAGPREESHMDLIDDELIKTSTSTPRQIISNIFSDEFNQANLLPTLWYMVATEQIGIDLNQPLTMISKLWSLHH
jgi:hypothetical protein